MTHGEWSRDPGAIDRLTRAVWVLVGLVAVLLVISTVTLVATIVMANGLGRTAEAASGIACELNRAYCRP